MNWTGRKDLRQVDPLVGKDACDVLYVNCGRIRGTFRSDALPEPGCCFRCRGFDPRAYWTRDWGKGEEE